MPEWVLDIKKSKFRRIPMPKGHKGETCAKAIRSIMDPGKILSFSEVYNQVKQRGSWKDETIWQHLMRLVVNLPPARLHWKNANPFLFLHGDGRYELYNPNVHPHILE